MIEKPQADDDVPLYTSAPTIPELQCEPVARIVDTESALNVWWYTPPKELGIGTLLYTSAPTISEGKMLIETAFLKMVSESLGRFVSDEGWAQHDMDVMDDLDARIAAAPKPECK